MQEKGFLCVDPVISTKVKVTRIGIKVYKYIFKNWVGKFLRDAKVFAGQRADGRMDWRTSGRPAAQTNTTDYIDPYVAHMDQ